MRERGRVWLTVVGVTDDVKTALESAVPGGVIVAEDGSSVETA